jgi:hypothetical protein
MRLARRLGAAGTLTVVALIASIAAAPAVVSAATMKLPTLPKQFTGSFDSTESGTPLYSQGELVDSAETLTMHVGNAVFERTGTTDYTLVSGTATVSDTGSSQPATVYGCPCEEKFSYDPSSPFSATTPLAGDFSITVAPGAESWEGASAFWVAVAVPTLDTEMSQTGTTTMAGVSQVIGPQGIGGEGVFVEVPVKVKVNPNGDYTIQYSTTVSDTNASGVTETETDSALLTGLPADDAPEVTALTVAAGSLKLSFELSTPAKATFTLQRQQGGRWVKVKAVTKRAAKGHNSLKLSSLFGAKALKKSGSYRVAIAASSGGHKSTEDTKAFTIGS